MRRFVAGFVLALAALIAAPVAAQAAAPVPMAEASAPVSVSVAALDQVSAPVAAAAPDDANCDLGGNCPTTVSQFITIDRWKGATSGFDQNIGKTDTGALLDLANRKVVQGMWMSVGNMSWDWALNTVSWAGGSQGMYQGLAYAIDSVVESLLRSLMNVGGLNVLSIVMVFAALLCTMQIIRQTRGAGAQMMRRLLSIALLMAYLTYAAMAMTGPSAPSSQQQPGTPTKQNPNVSTTYHPPVGTPSWIVTKVNQAVDKVANVPASIALQASPNPMGARNGGGGLGCFYVNSAFEQELANSELEPSAEMQIMIDRTWQMTGLTTWVKAQFGSNNYIGDDVYCYLLDMRSGGLSALQRMEPAQMAADQAGISNYPAWSVARSPDRLDLAPGATKNLSMFAPQSNEQKYASILAHAACNWDGSGFTFRPGFSGGNGTEDSPGFNPNKGQVSDGGKDTFRITGAGYEWGFSAADATAACTAAFTAPKAANWWEGTGAAEGADGKYLPGFILPGNEASIDYKVPGPRTKDFVSSFYGTTSSSATPIVFMYSALSWLATLPLIVLALASVLMRIVMTFMLIGLWVALVAAIFSPNPWEDKLKKPLIKVITTSVMATGLAAVLGIVVTTSTTITQIMRSLLVSGGGAAATTMSVIIACISPLVTILALNYIWRKTFDSPSPMSLKGGKAWMQGAPLGASALAAGAGGFLGSKLGQAAKRQGSRFMDNRMDEFLGRERGGNGGTSGRRSGMGGGQRRGSEGQAEDSNFTRDLREAQREKMQESVMKHGGKLLSNGKQALASGGRAFSQRAASAWRGAQENMRLASTAEGREMLMTNAWSRTKDISRAAGQSIITSGSRAASALGLDPATRQSIAFEAQAQGFGKARQLGMLGAASAAHVGGAAGRSVQAAARLGGRGAAAVGGAAHGAIMRSAGPNASIGQAYARFTKQAALVGASAVVPAIAPVALGGIALSNTVKATRSFRQQRANQRQHANEQLVAGLRARREEAKQAATEAAVAAREAAATNDKQAADAAAAAVAAAAASAVAAQNPDSGRGGDGADGI